MGHVGPIEPDGAYVFDWRPKKPFGKPRKRFCLLLILLGVCTFFLPMIILDSPTVNRTEWSPWNIVSKVFEGELPVPGGSFDLELIAMALIYVLMPFALMAVFRPGPPKALLVISSIGIGLDGALRHGLLLGLWHMDMFGTRYMRAGLALWVLVSIMPALLAICFAPNLDRERVLRKNL